MILTVNGEEREVPATLNLAGLLEHLSLPTERIAVEHNTRVISRKDWETISLNDRDRVEIIHFVGGG
jgi:thiamine biosynthesis protein ThiS